MAEAGAELIVLETDARHPADHVRPLEASLMSTGLPVWVGFSTRMSGDGSQGAAAGQP